MQICIVALEGSSLFTNVNLPTTEESINHIVEAIRICCVVMPGPNGIATGVYFCIEHECKPKEVRYFRFLGDQAMEEGVENEVWVRNVMFQNR